MGLAAIGCKQKAAVSAAAAQALPVQTAIVTLTPVAQSSEYVATIKSRRSATVEPQVQGMLTQIRVLSGDHV
jgi:multidrug efflux pump subunit AcrA (membrane-fusion protein)